MVDCTTANSDSSLNACSRVIEIRRVPRDVLVRAYMNRAAVERARGRIIESIADLTQAIRLDPRNDGALGDRARAYEQQGDVERAISDVSEMISLRSDPSSALRERSRLYRVAQQHDQRTSGPRDHS